MRIIQISKSVTTDRKLAPKLTPVIEAVGSLDWHHGITGYFSEMQILGPHPPHQWNQECLGRAQQCPDKPTS